MLIIIKSKANEEQIKSASEDLNNYIKFVVDIEKGIATIGGERHFDGEQLLISEGSNQPNLWGGGIDTETNEIDYDSIINIRPADNNPDRVVLSIEIRQQINEILGNLNIWKP